MNTQEKQWFVIYTKPRWEKKIYAKLLQKGIDAWCPLQKHRRQWTDRKKIVEEPLFKSYLFVRIDASERIRTLETEGVLNFVHFLGKPAVVKNEEIETIKSYLLNDTANLQVQSIQDFETNTNIIVRKGVFMDHKGKVLKTMGKNKVYVSLESIGQVMVVEFSTGHLEKI